MHPLTASPQSERVVVSPNSARATVAVVGAGAVGGYFGGMLARAGVPVAFIGRPAFVEAVRARGLRLETTTFTESIPVRASTEFEALRGVDLVLVCVKSQDTRTAAAAIAPFVGSATTVLSLQNGVENVDGIRQSTTAIVLPSVVYLAASTPSPGTVKHTGRGDLVIGPGGERTRWIQSLFQHAGVPCKMTEDIAGEMWEKFICNCALNAISAISQRTYGEIGRHTESRSLVESSIREALRVANRLGVTPTNMTDEAAAIATVLRLTQQIAGAISSTAQDLRNGKRTEIDALNGFIARQGREIGIPVPVNHTLYSLVKFLEASGNPDPIGRSRFLRRPRSERGASPSSET